jgi:hypothetical protein
MTSRHNRALGTMASYSAAHREFEMSYRPPPELRAELEALTAFTKKLQPRNAAA